MNKKLMVAAVAGALFAPGLTLAQAPPPRAGSALTTPAQSPAFLRAPGGSDVTGSPGLSIYGRLDSMIMANSYTEDYANRAIGANPATTGRSKVSKGDLYQAGNSMGVRGREDLGGGTIFFFQLEIGVWTERLETSTVTGNNWGGRNSWLGFDSGLGGIYWGISDSPYKQVDFVGNLISSSGLSGAGIIMNNGDTTGALPNALCTNTVNNGSGAVLVTSANSSVCTTEATGGGTQFSRRNNDSINYRTPVIGGFQLRLQTALNTYQSPSTSPGSATVAGGQLPKAKYYSGAALWARGPFEIGVGYDMHQAFRQTNTATANANAKDTGVQVGARWDFGMGVIGAGYEKLAYGAIDGAPITNANRNSGKMDVPAYFVNARLNAGPGQVFVAYTATPGGKSCFEHTPVAGTTNVGTTIGSASCGSDGKATIATLGYDYVLSKRTKFYVAYNKIDNGDGTNYFYIAGPAGNNANGTSSGIQAGTDVSTFGVGVQHAF